ncbi:MAG: hypothetical protein ACFB50_12125 [Rubrobacteraceae bacterium]
MPEEQASERRPLSGPGKDYRAKMHHEARLFTRRLKGAGYPEPLGDPASGIMIVVGQPVGPRVVNALERSLEAITLPDAYVTWSNPSLLMEEILSLQPSVLVSIGPEAARDIDSLNYPLLQQDFSNSTTGQFFPWTGTTTGLAIPALAPALDDEGAKKRFWHAFLTLQRVSQTRPKPTKAERPLQGQ